MSEWNAFEHSAEVNPPEKNELWKSYTMLDSGDVHNVPLDDGIGHDLNADCPCHPEVGEVTDGGQGLLYHVYGHHYRDERKT